MTSITELAARIASRDTPRTEATLQSDVRQLLLDERLGLSDQVLLESRTEEGGRIDVEVGSTIIEVKRDLRSPRVLKDAIKQLSRYVRDREAAHTRRYVGVLTDGAEWRCYHLRADELEEVGAPLTLTSAKPNVDALLIWLEGVLATARDIRPTPDEISRRLGVGSTAHALDSASLTALYQQHHHEPVVRTKRRLWARLLETALGTQFDDSDALFVEHTLLVNTAEIIAHAVLGLTPETLAPRSILSGQKFEEAGVHGVVEADFFDWVVDVPRGEAFVRSLARRLARFDWRAVEHDVLKVLYESVIGTETRKKLGEYYTPDWLAQKVVEAAVPAPLHARVLDPACGSGTFLFHLVRRYLRAGERESRAPRSLLEGLTRHVLGMDLHPVAVTLARVTYLLAIGPERLARERDPIRIPVFLGDSMQWGKARPTLWSTRELRVPVDDQRELTKSDLVFPQSLLADPGTFDELVSQLVDLATRPRKVGSRPSLTALFRRLAIAKDDQPTISATFALLCRLHDEGRDHIWGYYIRNLARPEWLARPENQVDALVGNPPWLAYRHMSGEMQAEFREMSEARDLWHGKKLATQQDLSALFVVRAMELYLGRHGRFAFVMPSAVLDRQQYAGFRSGSYAGKQDQLELSAALEAPWDLRKVRPHFFPITASVVFGRRTASASAMPAAGERWSGKLKRTNATWDQVAGSIRREASSTDRDAGSGDPRSPYHARFRNGATIYPRLLFMVERMAAGPLGQVRNRVSVRSTRSANEKPPWKLLPAQEGVVESEFVYRVYFGESVLPFRMVEPFHAVLPIDGRRRLDDAAIEGYPGLASWWAQVTELWEGNRSPATKIGLADQLDYHGKLSGQLPLASSPRERVVYTKSGMHLAAARLNDPRAIIDHKLYWATATSPAEAQYLCAILNAPVVTQLVRPLMSYGKDERDIDKYVWLLPIPEFAPADPLHARLAALGAESESLVNEWSPEKPLHFPRQRALIRDLLARSEVGRATEAAVCELLGEAREKTAPGESEPEARLSQLIQEGRAVEARTLARGTPWERILAPPTATPGRQATARGDLPANLNWLREEGPHYGGKWVALKDGELVLMADTRAALLQALRPRDDRATLMVTRVDALRETDT